MLNNVCDLSLLLYHLGQKKKNEVESYYRALTSLELSTKNKLISNSGHLCGSCLQQQKQLVSSREAVHRDMARRQECLDVVGGSCAATYSNANFCTPRPGCPQQGDPQGQGVKLCNVVPQFETIV